MRIPLTAAILTLNEVDQVAAAIGSVAADVERVVVIDSGSDDGTLDAARSAGADVLIHRAKPFVIADQRNWALDQLMGSAEWVLFLDADERATQPYLGAIRAAIADGSKDGYAAAPRFMYQGTWLRRYMGFPNWHPRLVNANRCRLVGGVWETFPPSADVGYIEEPYIHLANSKGFDDWLERHRRYASWEAQVPDQDAVVRRPWLRALGRRIGGLRPFLALGYHLIVRGGCLDGGSVWSYARRHFAYELMIQEFRREIRRDAEHQPR